MPRKGDIVFVPAAIAGGPGTPLDLIPDEIKRDVEECYLALKAAGGAGRMKVEFDTADEVKEFRRQVESYCKLRPTDVAAIHALFVTPATDETEAVDVVENGAKTATLITSGGPLKFRASPVKGNPDTIIEFKILDIPAPDPAKEQITNAVEAVKAGTDVGEVKEGTAGTPEVPTATENTAKVPESDVPAPAKSVPTPTPARSTRKK